PVAVVVIEPRGPALVCGLGAVGRLALKLTAAGILKRKLGVVGDEEVEAAVVVIVEPCGRCSPVPLIGCAAAGRHVAERPVAIVMKESARGLARAVNVG